MTYLKVDNKFVYLPNGQMLGIPPPPPPSVLTFYTDAYETNFYIYIATTSGTLEWDMGDGSTLLTNIPNYKYNSPGEKIVKVFEGTTSGKTAIKQIVSYGTDIIYNTLDLTGLTSLEYISTPNNRINSIIFPTSSVNSFSFGGMINNDILNISSIDTSTLGIAVRDSSILSHIIFPTSTTKLTNFNLTNLNEIKKIGFPDTSVGTIDLSNINEIVALFTLENIPQINNIIFKNEATFKYISFPGPSFKNTGLNNIDFSEFSDINLYGLTLSGNAYLENLKFPTENDPSILFLNISTCPLLTSVDASNFINFSSMRLTSLSSLKGVYLPVSYSPFNFYMSYCPLITSVDLTNCLGGFEVNQALSITYCSSLNEIIFPSIDFTVASLDLYGNDLTGEIDLSNVNITNMLSVHSNKNLTGVLFKDDVSIKSLTYSSASTNINDELDLSKLVFLEQLNLQKLGAGTYIKNLIFPTTLKEGVIFSNLYLANLDCSILNFSWLDNKGWKPGQIFGIVNCSKLTELILPDVSANVGHLSMGYNNALKSVDISKLPNITGSMSIFGSSLETILFPPAFNQEYTQLIYNNSKLDQTTVDTVLSLLSAFYNLNPPTKNLAVYLNGGANSPPTNGSNNSDILNLQSIFSSAGISLILNYNT